MNVPVDARAETEFRVDRWEETGAQHRRDEGLDGLVKDKREQDFVNMIGKGRE